MDLAPEKTVSVDEAWVGLNDSLKRSVCDALFKYSSNGVGRFFEGAVRSAHARKLELEARSQFVATVKRRLDDSDASHSQPDPKKAKVLGATAPPQAENIDIASPKIPFAWPSFRQAPTKFGQPTLSSAIGDKSTTATPRSVFSPTNKAAGTGFPTFLGPDSFSFGSRPSLFSGPSFAFGNAKTQTPVQKEPDCDEQFTFADRRGSQPQPPNQQGPSTQYSSPYQPSPASSSASSQAVSGLPPIQAVSKAPFPGVDMSSLKIPANSHVSVTLNVFEAPSSLHQTSDSGAPRKLKCIQCGAFYMEAQNTALECRRHTGTCVAFNHPKLAGCHLPAGAYHVWDCCRRTTQSQGCCPCNHYAG